MTSAKVALVIADYWRALGAKALPEERDPLAIPPLSLKKTAELAFAVSQSGKDERGATWIAVYDSERYTADPALARHLAETLAVPVVFYEVSGASGDHAYVKVYGEGGPTPPARADTQAWLEGFPFPLVYFNHLAEDRKATKKHFSVFGFADVPYRPKAKYSGPSEEERRELEAEAKVAEHAARGDAAGVLAVGAEHPHAMLEALHALDRKDLSTVEGNAYVLELAEPALDTSSDLHVVAEAAARAGDERLLARATTAMGTRGWMWGLLEARAMECVQKKELAIGWRLLQACIEGPSPSLTAWNNHAWALAALPAAERARFPARPITAETMKPWLERALAVAPTNVGIFHNVACAAVALGLRELALDAVAGAAKHRYDKLAALRTDDDLASLRGDPRFEAAFAGKSRLGPDDLAALVTVLPIRGEPHVVHRAVVSMTFYFAGSLVAVAPRIGILLDAYRADLPPGKLAFYKRGHWKPLTKAMSTRERKLLDAIPPRYEGFSLHWRDTDGDAAEHDFEAEGSREDGGASAVLTFPVRSANEPEALVAKFGRWAAASGCESAHAGFDVTNRVNDAYEGVSWNRDELGSRFMAFQHRSSWWKKGRTPPAHWLVWLSLPLVKALGGASALKKALGAATATEDAGALLIRASRRCPLAPVDDPDDRGALPDVARALRPLRIQARGDANARFARWDELEGLGYE